MISVIIPAFNSAKFLARTLDSVFIQKQAVNMSPLEVIFVDDGSEDNTRTIFQRYLREQPSSTLITQKRSGPGAARNAGLAAAHGEFIVFCDADDILPFGVLAEQALLLHRNHDVDAAVCRTVLFENEDVAGNPIPKGRWRLFLNDLDIHLCHFNIAPPAAWMFRRKALQMVSGFDTTDLLEEDHDFFFRLAYAGARIVPNFNAWIAYRKHDMGRSYPGRHLFERRARQHNMIADAILSQDFFPDRGRLEGVVACLAACLCTRAEFGEEDPFDLRGTAQRLAEHLALDKAPPGRGWGTLEYLVLRASIYLSPLCGKADRWADRIRECMEKTISDMPAKYTSAGILADMLEEQAQRITEDALCQPN